MTLSKTHERLLLFISDGGSNLFGMDRVAARTLARKRLLVCTDDVYQLTVAGKREAARIQEELDNQARVAQHEAVKIVYCHLFDEARKHPQFYCGANHRPANWAPPMEQPHVRKLVDNIAAAILGKDFIP